MLSTVIPSRGTITTAPHVMAPSSLTQFPQALVWNGSTYSLIWHEGSLAPPSCFLCTSVLEQKISLVDGSGNLLGRPATSDTHVIVGVQQSGSELLVAFNSGGSIYTRLFTFSGQSLANAVPVLSPARPSRLAPAPGGFALLYQGNSNEIGTVLLDDRGNPRSEAGPIVRSEDFIQLEAAVFANATTWLAYTTPIPVGGEPPTARRALTRQLKQPGGKLRAVR
jgi:hypothetical protein